MFCSSCGKTVADGTAFCSACGRPIVGYSVGQTSAAAASGGGAIAGAGVAPAFAATQYAGFWLRFVAVIIDRIILGIPFGIIFFMVMASALPAIMALSHSENPNPFAIVMTFLPRFMFLAILALVASWLYWALMESSEWQATLGKKALGLYVTDLGGRRLTFGRASGRFFGGRGIGSVPSIGGLYYLVDCILAGFTEKKQALHDMIASCLVMRKS
jgi:uncharacterized RDD family membrane protein YckC